MRGVEEVGACLKTGKGMIEMEPPEVLAFVAVLLLALYGCMCAIKRLLLFALKPRHTRLCMVVPLDKTVDNAEQHVRYARQLVLHFGWRLYVVDDGMTTEQREIVDRLLVDGIGEYASGEKKTR